MEKIILNQTINMSNNLNRVLVIICLILSQMTVLAQNREITGFVADNAGEPIIGANILVKGQKGVGTITNVDGKYTIEATAEDILEVSYIGFKTKTKKVGNRKTIDFILEVDNNILDDVVVIGYGTAKRVNLAGSVATTDKKAFISKPSATPTSALQGVIPGLVVNRGSGSGSRPGVEDQIVIRDVSSVNGGSPLVLIDGAEGNINSLNPTDIESVSVLKDAQAAIYGNRASNGVILVTTKHAEEGKVRVDFNAYYAIKTPTNIMQKVNLLEFAEMDREACADGSDNPVYSEEELELIRQDSDIVKSGSEGYLGYTRHYKHHDWMKSMLRKGSSLQNYSLNVYGGSKKAKFYISAFYQAENSPLRYGHDDDHRLAIRIKNDINILDNLAFHSNLSYSENNRDYSTASGNALAWALRQSPWAPMYTPSGKFLSWQGYGNPAQDLEEGGNTTYNNATTTMNFSLDWEIIKGLKLTGQAVLRKQMNDDFVWRQKYAQWNWDDSLNRYNTDRNWAQKSFSKGWYKNYNVFAEYQNVFKNKHDFKIMLGAQHEEYTNDAFSATRYNFSGDNFNLALGDSKNQEANQWTSAETMRSVYGRASYVYGQRYILEINARYDGTSRFAKGHRWGFFSGYSAAWRLSEENFMKDLNIFDQFKIRASWGQMGNAQGLIGKYDYIPVISISNQWPYPFDKQEVSQSATSNMVSLTRTWEKLEVTNVGLDIAILNNRLNFNADYFHKRNKNMLIPVEYPSSLGAVAPATNNGVLIVNGWELALSWRDSVKDFNYSITANISDARNKVTYLGGFNGLRSGMISHIQGYPTYTYFGYKTLGIIRDEETLAEYKKLKGIPDNIRIGDMMYADLDGDGAITPTGDMSRGFQGDLISLGDNNPHYSFGLNFSFDWKGIDFSMFFQGVGKRSLILDGEPLVPFLPDWHYPMKGFYHNTWSVDRPDAKYPILTHDDDRNAWNYRTSDNLIINAGYLRLKNLQLGYTIPQKITQKMHISRLRVYFSGNDLFEIHNVPFHYDPEMNGSYSSYPFMRYYSFGLNLNF